jgi:hypothetical protein
MSAFAISKLVSPCRLHGAIAHAPLVLGEQYTAQLGRAGGRIVERSEDALAIVDRQRQDDRLPLDRRPEERGGRFVDEIGQDVDELVPDGDAGELHAREATRRRGPTNGCVA